MTEAPGIRVGQGRRPVARRPWPRLPRWFWFLLAIAVLAFAALGTYAVRRILSFEEQPVFERRTPPLAGEQSHDIGEFHASTDAVQDVACGAIAGLRVQGDDIVRPLLADALGGLCRRLGALDPRLADRVKAAADKGAIISFGIFERTGDASTTVAGSPPRILINTSYAGAFKGYLLGVLAHELWHGGSVDVTAADELAARRIEDEICTLVVEIRSIRGCEEAREIVEVGESVALDRLRDAGYR